MDLYVVTFNGPTEAKTRLCLFADDSHAAALDAYLYYTRVVLAGGAADFDVVRASRVEEGDPFPVVQLAADACTMTQRQVVDVIARVRSQQIST
jgi:hypothetical protein